MMVQGPGRNGRNTKTLPAAEGNLVLMADHKSVLGLYRESERCDQAWPCQGYRQLMFGGSISSPATFIPTLGPEASDMGHNHVSPSR